MKNNHTDAPFRDRARTEILTLALSIVAKEGLQGLQARRIAREAGCSVGSLYNIFGDINGLIIASNIETVAALETALLESFSVSEGRPIDDRLLDLALTYCRFALENLNLWRAVFEHRLPPDQEVPLNYRADQARLLSLIAKIIAGEIDDQDLRERAARALFAAVHGIVALAVDSKLGAFEEARMQDEVRFIVKAAAAGLKSAT
jgi:AcrR family transcriptional regulator